MPNRVRDSHSGAILFVPTDEEKEIAALKERVSKLERAQKMDTSAGQTTSAGKTKKNH